jgi:potassium-transporting ATPase ATP-binding subunit
LTEDQLNVIGLGTPESAIMSAIVFNARHPRSRSAACASARPAPRAATPHLPIDGVGGLVAPFAGTKLVDLAVTDCSGA